MDTRTGELYAAGNPELAKLLHNSADGPYIKGFDEANLDTATRAELLATGRAQLRPRSKCPCGSGRRFKSCCMAKGR